MADKETFYTLICMHRKKDSCTEHRTRSLAITLRCHKFKQRHNKQRKWVSAFWSPPTTGVRMSSPRQRLQLKQRFKFDASPNRLHVSLSTFMCTKFVLVSVRVCCHAVKKRVQFQY